MKLFRFLFYACLMPALLACSAKNEVTVLKLAHSLDTQHPVHHAIVYMAQRLEHHSAGSMRVDIYPAGQLGSERELIELLQIGSLAMTKVSSSPMEGFVPAMKIFSIPYVFRDSSHYWQVLNSDIGRELLLAGQSVRLRGLAYYDAGARSFYSVHKPVHAPADLNGMKIRVQQSPTAIEMVRAFGGSATPISWGELYTSLQQGVVDGAENNPPSFYSSKHYEVAKYFTLNEHTRVPDIMLISQYIWDHLSTQQQQWLQTAMDESVEFQRKLWEQSTEEALEKVRQAGVQVIYPDKALFRENVLPMQDALQGTPVFDVLQRIRNLRSPP
jgi:tripartite ATP-independent transporter DctP family solute receptor